MLDKETIWSAYQSLSATKQHSMNSILFPKQKKSVDEILDHMESKGITFNIISRDSAKYFLQHNNYYFKLAAYRANYVKGQRGPKTGKYLNLDFAYLKELSTIDMHLRYLILQMCLDIEHHVKIMLIRDIENNPKENGYHIVDCFDPTKEKRVKILKHAKNSYSYDLIYKYGDFLNYPVWALCEVIDFGTLCFLYKQYKEEYPERTNLPKHSLLNPIRNLRNAAAHSNCLIYKLRVPKNLKSSQKRITISDINKIIAAAPTINRSMRSQYLNILPIHDFAVLLYWYSSYVESKALLHQRKLELYKLFLHRMKEHANYFETNQYIQNAFLFCTRLVIHFFGKY